VLERTDAVRPLARPAQPEPSAPAQRRLTALVGCTWPLMAMGVKEAAARGGIHCYAVVSDAEDLVDQVGRQRPDLCLLIHPFTAELPDVIFRLAQVSRSTRAVVLAADESAPSEVLAALRAGAHGWLPMNTDSSRLVDALRAVARGEAAVPRSLMSTVLAELRGAGTREVLSPDGTICELPPREHDVLLGLAEGQTTAQIAARLGIGDATVRGYVATAVRRLGVPDRRAAVALVRRADERSA